MTRDEIIKPASQAIDDTRSEVDLPVPFVLRFANLVIADFLAQTGQYVTNDASREAAIKKAVDAEREVCAKACDDRAEAWQAAHLAGQRAMQTRAGEVANKTAERILAANTHRGRTSSAGSFASGVAEDIGCDIRALEVKP